MLSLGDTQRFAPDGGRPCDQAFPYFRLNFPQAGVTLAVGWPGQWCAAFTATGEKIRLQAGQEITRLRLEPGERIRTPRITVLAWEGSRERAINLWRRWYQTHILPRPLGVPLAPLLACAATDGGEEFTNANETNQLFLMDAFQQEGIHFDVWWIDAGWYPCQNEAGKRRWWRTGSWSVDRDRFPNGLKPVSAHVEELHAKLLLWFEPERVHAGSWLDQQHPEWMLKRRATGVSEDPLRLLNLGDPGCLAWLIEHLCGFIAENGVSIYRQDFNFPPLAYWRENDQPESQGMRENLHIQGYLRLWDELLRRNPGLWIDSCASGGRRNDLESMRRSVPLHYSDYGYGEHAVKLAFQHTLLAWIPYFKETTLSWDTCQAEDDLRYEKQVDPFSFHCAMAAMMSVALDIRRRDYDYPAAQKLIGIWRAVVDIFLRGDYYPLTPFSKSADQWMARQFDLPEEKRGVLQVIRLPTSEQDQLMLQPHAIPAHARCTFENPENGTVFMVSGEQIQNSGIQFEQARRSGAIWFYHYD
jgi:alpha-galactosidase